jgi:hypothetical protein
VLQELLDQMALPVLEVQLDQQVLQEHWVLQEPQVIKATRVTKVRLGQLEHKVQQVQLDLQVPQV